MVDYWSENGPPVSVSAAAYLGLTGKKKKKAKTSTAASSDNERNLAALAAEFAGTGGVYSA